IACDLLWVGRTVDFLPQRDRGQRIKRIIWMAVASFTVVVMAAAFAAFIRARFRFESGALLGHGCAQPFQHFLEDAVLADTQKSAGGIAADLRLGVSIAEVKSATQQVARRGAFDP